MNESMSMEEALALVAAFKMAQAAVARKNSERPAEGHIEPVEGIKKPAAGTSNDGPHL